MSHTCNIYYWTDLLFCHVTFHGGHIGADAPYYAARTRPRGLTSIESVTHGRRKNRLRASGRVINSTECVPRGLQCTHRFGMATAPRVCSRTHTRVREGSAPMRLRREGGQAGATCEVFHAVHLDDSGRGLSGCPRDKRPRLA